MNRRNFSILRLAATAALATGFAIAVWADEPPATAPQSANPPSTWGGWGPTMGPGGMMGMGPGMMGMGPGGMFATPAEIQKRMADAKQQLGIEAAQESAWKAYEQAVTDQSSLMNAHRQFMISSGPPPVEERLAMHQEGLRVAQKTAQAAQDLYKVLTPEQRTKTNALPWLGMGPGYGMWPTPTAPAAAGTAPQGK